MSSLSLWWRRYRFRFVPLIARDFDRRCRRPSPRFGAEFRVDDAAVKAQLTSFLTQLGDERGRRRDSLGSALTRWRRRITPTSSEEDRRGGVEIMKRTWGFAVECRTSGLGEEAGRGVFVLGNDDVAAETVVVPAGHLVALYPGTFYAPGEPLLIASIANPYVFRCADGMLLDGNGKRLSGAIFRSLLHRDSTAPIDFVAADATWTTEFPLNPLSVGQIVNNADDDDDSEDSGAANVTYHEIALKCPEELSFDLLQHLPYLRYSPESSIQSGSRIKCVVLVSTRPIRHGEELFSAYFSLLPLRKDELG